MRFPCSATKRYGPSVIVRLPGSDTAVPFSAVMVTEYCRVPGSGSISVLKNSSVNVANVEEDPWGE